MNKAVIGSKTVFLHLAHSVLKICLYKHTPFLYWNIHPTSEYDSIHLKILVLRTEYPMGGICSCFSRPITDEVQPKKAVIGRYQNTLLGSLPPEKKQTRHMNSSAQNKFRKVGYMTLEDCLLASPSLNAHPRVVGGEIQIFKHLPTNRVFPSSTSPDTGQEFFTPRRSFSGADCKLGRIDEDYGQDADQDSSRVSSISRSGSGKVKKKVRFRLPEEADIYIYYTPKGEFEE